MSLINQMLHDLDNRRPRDESRSAGYVVAGLHSPRAAFSSAAVALASRENRISTGANILLLSLGILLAAVVWRYMSLVSDQGNTAPAGAKSGTAIIEKQPLEVAPQQGIQLASLSTSLTDGGETIIPKPGNAAPLIEHTEIPGTINKHEPVMPSTSASAVHPAHQLFRPESSTPKTGVTGITKKFRPLSPEQIAEAAYRAGIENIQKGKISEGMRELQNALASHQGHIKAREILAGLLIRSGQSNEAGDLLNKGIELHPGNSQYVKLYSRILLEQGKREMAIQVLEANKPALINDLEYFAILAAVYQQLKQHHEAARIYTQLVNIQPGRGVFWMGLGISLEADGKHDKALEAYQRAKVSGNMDSNVMQFINDKITFMKNA